MPIYEYECMDCNHYLDELQKMSDEPLKDCPKCHKPKLKRLLSAPSFRLKGGGWYETDFKKENQRNIVKSDSDNDKNKTSSKKEDSGSKVKDNNVKNSPKTESKKTKSSK